MNRRWLVPAACLAVLFTGAGVAVAASLGLTSSKLTVYGMCLLQASKDTTIDEGSPSSNFGTSSELSVLSTSTANKRLLVSFPIASCSIPAGADVQSARLELFMTSAPGSSRSYAANRVTDSWLQTTANWSNQPAVVASPTSTSSTGTTSSVWLTWDVQADVAAIVAGLVTDEGWRMTDAAEGDPSAPQGTFASREFLTTTSRPKLTIGYYP